MKKSILIAAIILAMAAPACAADYVLMALQVQSTVIEEETVYYYALINGAVTKNVPARISRTLATSGAWNMVLFQLENIKPDGMTKKEAGAWLANADGFLGFDFRMLYEGERLGASIQNRTFDYTAVLNAVIQLEWWTLVDGEYVKSEGSRADWAAASWPKMARVKPMPHYLGRPNDTY